MPMECQLWHHEVMARVTRETSKAMTRQRLLEVANRLFRERGYTATSLDQIADAADVTKGAIYGHFSSKEDLLLSSIEAEPLPDFGPELNDVSRPLRERLAEFGRTIAVDMDLDENATDRAALAMHLEFLAALLRNPGARQRYAAELGRRLDELAAADEEEPLPGTTAAEAWAIGTALLTGLQINRFLAPEIFTPALFERAFEPFAELYPEP
jgi:AcrR family transcriptional regulator